MATRSPFSPATLLPIADPDRPAMEGCRQVKASERRGYRAEGHLQLVRKRVVSGQASASRRSEAGPGWGCAVSGRLGESGGGFESDFVAEGFKLANVVALLTFWVDA